ncbi:MAG TPA: hypothetical protein VMQ86_13610, partial [Bryobacteraceae bacterium]|nr:hypothetical protein [Bryobacteraceae bacterium]
MRRSTPNSTASLPARAGRSRITTAIPNRVLIEGGIRGVGVFYIDGEKFRIPPGFHMLWRTLS